MLAQVLLMQFCIQLFKSFFVYAPAINLVSIIYVPDFIFMVLQNSTMSLLGECRDINGLAVKHGLMYMAGPGECHQCVCESGVPKNCQDVMCHQPQVLLALFLL